MDPHPAEPVRDGPLPSRDEVIHCQISSWYPTFSRLPPNNLKRTKGTMQTVIINLPNEFKEYLRSDGIQLPLGSKTSSLLPPENHDDDSDGSSNYERVNSLGVDHKTVAFPDLDNTIEAAIKDLEGSIAPKLNWSAPKDAIWMNNGTLKCQTSGDIYLLLKASDFCSYDLHHALQDVQDNPSTQLPDNFCLQLALRKWCNLYPSQEFRCFVKENDLIAISQRNHSQHFPHLPRDAYMIRSLIVEFFDEVIQNKFADGLITQYIFDCYIDQKEKVWILDFNVWGRRTDTLLFTWEELEEMDSDMPEIRVVQTEKQVRSDPLASYRAPIDAVHVASLTGGNPKAFEELMKLCNTEPTGPGSDSEESDNE
jgi:hypothetical protein